MSESVSSVQHLAATYAQISRELASVPAEYRKLATLAAESEAAYKAARAKRRLQARADGEARTAGEAENVADADEYVADLHMAYLTNEAAAEACKQSLYSLRARLSYGQTLIGAEREADKQAAMSGPGWQR